MPQLKYDRERYLANRAAVIERAAKWAAQNPEKVKAAKLKYKGTPSGKASERRYKKARRAPSAKARVGWRNQSKIDAMYEEAELIGMVVDHIFPLKSDLVCGLHCEDNLWIVSKGYNRRKNNRLRVVV